MVGKFASAMKEGKNVPEKKLGKGKGSNGSKPKSLKSPGLWVILKDFKGLDEKKAVAALEKYLKSDEASWSPPEVFKASKMDAMRCLWYAFGIKSREVTRKYRDAAGLKHGEPGAEEADYRRFWSEIGAELAKEFDRPFKADE